MVLLQYSPLNHHQTTTKPRKRLRDDVLRYLLKVATFAEKKIMSTATDRFEKAWQKYTALLSQNPQASLAPFLRDLHVSVGAMSNWMSRNGLSVIDAKRHARALQMEERLKSLPHVVSEDSSMFVPVIPRVEKTDSGEMLFGISVTLPDGVIITVKQGSAQALVSFIRHYSGKEGESC